LNLPVLSLTALLIAIVISCFSRLNVGFLSIAFALIIGVFFGGMKASAVLAGFPAGLFLTLVGITLLFSQARVNGTLDKVARLSVKLARNNPGLIPVIFFALALLLATIGIGNIAAAALLAPIALVIGEKAGVTAFLMTIMLANGANAGGLSPFAPTGIIANDIMAKIGLTGFEWRNYFNTLIAQSFIAFAGYFALGGLKLFTRRGGDVTAGLKEQIEPFTGKQKLTLGVIAALVASVVLLKVDVTLGAFAGAVLLSLCGASDEEAAVKAIPWGAILMVCGVTVLIALMEKTGGMELFTTILAKFSTQTSITAVIAFVTGVISVYSSSSGVVLPAFLPTIPGLIAKLGGGDALAIASSINVGAHLVDVSPLSTLGALCLANAPASENRAALFNKLLIWGLAMSVVGAAVCFVFFGLLF
jgi:di/tricarboxylate transporter